MKKCILLISLFFLIFIPNVKADERICSSSKNLLKPNNFIQSLYQPFEYSPSSVGFSKISYNGLIPVLPNTAYYFNSQAGTSTPVRYSVVYYDKDFKYLEYKDTRITTSGFTFTTLENAYYITLHFYNFNFTDLNSKNVQLEEGTKFTSYVDFEEKECDPILNPDTPYKPTPQETEQTKILTNFFDLFIEKLKMLCEYASSNILFMSFIVVILIFVILELFFKIFKIGGGK